MDISIITIFILAIFVGFEIITKVPPTLHTPLMSGSNAISGIAIIGALLATQLEGYGDDREAAIDSVIAQLNKHGMTVLGENQAIDLENSRKILDLAVA